MVRPSEGVVTGMGKQEPLLGDPEIRQALRLRLSKQHAKQRDTVFLDEFGICRGRRRIDLAVVNSSFHGYEIKSDRDTLRRLDNQVELYSKVVDRATVVLGERHLSEAMAVVPNWWGVLLIHPGVESPRIKIVRRARKNPGIDPRSLVELLWLDDAVALLEQRDAARGIRGKPRRIVWDRVCEYFKVSEIAAAVREQLKARRGLQVPVQQ